MRQVYPCDTAMEALGWAQYTHTGNPGSRLTLMWIAHTMVGGSDTECDGLVRIDVEEIAEETDQTVEDVEHAVTVFRALGLVQTRWVKDDITSDDPPPVSGNRDFLVTSLKADLEDFRQVADRVAASTKHTENMKGVLA